VASDGAQPWISQSYLRDVQYRTDANLVARQSIYACQRPRRDLRVLVLGRCNLRGSETVADVGCGNGGYLAELARRGHAGPLAGVDMSVGMLRAARERAAAARVLAGDAAALPLRDAVSDLTLAMHMLYHVPGQEAAVGELRRVTRPGGQLVVGLNGDDHLRELRDLVRAALADCAGRGRNAAPAACERLRLDQGQQLLARAFRSVARHDFTAWLQLTRGPVEGYVRSMPMTQGLADPESLVTAVGARVAARPGAMLRVRTHSGCLICR
jgi:SAM-dependent methyltransferase